MEHNPYAPPSASSEPAPAGLVFSSEGVEVVTSMAKWMRALSTFYYVALALMVLGGGCAMLGALAAGPEMLAVLVGFVLGGLLIGASATWLRDAADYFEKGVIGDDEFSLGMGFRKMRSYWILFGIMGILSVISNISTALEVL